MIKKLFLPVLLIVSFHSYGQRIKAMEAKDTLDYDVIKMESLDINNDTDFTSFEIFDSVVAQSNIFFAGENHQYRYSNTKMQIKLLEYLNQKAGVRTLIMEFGFSRGWLLDKYINTQDSTYKAVFKNYSYKEYSDFYDKLRDYNLKLPDSLRIHVAGIDVERYNDLPIKVLSLLLPDKEPSDSIVINVEAIRGMAGYLDYYLNMKKNKDKKNEGFSSFSFLGYNSRSYSSKKTVYAFVKDVIVHKQYYKEYLGDNFEIFEKIINELIDQQKYEDYYNTTQQYVFRERYMYSKFIKLIKEQPDTKIFGQFGRCHVAMDKQDKACNWFEFNAFAARINKSDNEWLKDKVCTFAYFYNNDETFSESIADNGKIDKILEKAAKLDTFVAIEISSDTTFFGDYPKWYKFLIYNNKTRAEESEDLDVENYYSNETEGNIAFFGGYRRPLWNMNTINTFMGDNNYTLFNTDIHSVSVGMQVNQISGFCMGFNGLVTLQDQGINTSDTSVVKLNSGSFIWNWGWNFLNSKHFFLKPNVGIGVNTYRLTFYEGDEKVVPQLDIFGGRKSEVFMNVSFIMDYSVEAIVKFGYAGLGFKYGYLWDTSKGYWKNMDNVTNTTSPKLKASGQYAQATLLLMIDY